MTHSFPWLTAITLIVWQIAIVPFTAANNFRGSSLIDDCVSFHTESACINQTGHCAWNHQATCISTQSLKEEIIMLNMGSDSRRLKKKSPKPSTQKPSASPSSRNIASKATKVAKKPTSKPTTQTIDGAIGVPIFPNSAFSMVVKLPQCKANQLITVSKVSQGNDDEVPVARSYDSLPYETLHPLLLPVSCISSKCTVEIPPNDPVATHYIIREYNPPSRTVPQKVAKLLLQGTYGPTQTSLSEAMSMPSMETWVRDQIDKPPTLLRTEYRRRVNAHLRTDLRTHGSRPACEPGSRWNRHAFNAWRDVGKTIVEEDTKRNSWFLKIDGTVRTEVSTRPSSVFNENVTSYVICHNTDSPMSRFAEAPEIKGKMSIGINSTMCMNIMFHEIDMPPVYFNEQGNFPSVNLVNLSDPYVIEDKILQDIVPPSTCENFNRTWPNFVKDSASGLYYVEDRRVQLYDNTNGANPQKKRLLDGRCPQVEKTFLNQDTCVIRSDCTAPAFSGEFVLNATNLRQFYEIDEKYVYRIQGLPLIETPSPCDTDINRFVRKNATTDSSGCAIDSSASYPEIQKELTDFLNNLSIGDRDSKRVIDLNTTIGCTDPTEDALGKTFTVTIPGTSTKTCWTHSYSWEWSVLVVNRIVVTHPGSPKLYRESKPNPIAVIAEREKGSNLEDSITLNFPSWEFHKHNFHDNAWKFEDEYLGAWGDRVSFNNLPDKAKSKDVITRLGGTIVEESREVIEVCGSPGEIANDPSMGHQYLLQKFGEADEEYSYTLDQDHERWQSSKYIWNTAAVNAPDQLRQRVAWALANIFVVTESSIDLSINPEFWSTYYDIFVRNAFGSSFLNLLKEVAFSPMMGLMLTYEGSLSQAYHIERNGVEFHPDENFAREIMQLFTIGLYMLNEDGTKRIDPSTGQPILAYTNNDVENFSRGWTNFKIQNNDRDNIEAEWALDSVRNVVDPMFFPSSEGRDPFPKQTLLVEGKRGYIGDQVVPRCDSLPNRPWLRKGAVWEFRENAQSLLGKRDPDWWIAQEDETPRMILDPATSVLYKKLCNKSILTGKCQFESTVILDETISCIGTCKAGHNQTEVPTSSCECSIDEPRTVRIDHSSTVAPVWYEYKKPACIQMAFPESGYLRTVKEIGAAGYGNKAMCADTRLQVAGTTCCDPSGSPANICVFRGERTNYNTAEERCAAYGSGYSTCSWDTVGINFDCGTDVDYESSQDSVHKSPGMRFSWTSDSCLIKVQIDQDGRVAMVHSVGSDAVKERVGVDTGTYFGVFWDSGPGAYPRAKVNCTGTDTCQVHHDTCICTTSVLTTQVFDGSIVPSGNDLLSQLLIGGLNPSLLDANYYSLCTAPKCAQSGYKIWSRVLVASDSKYTKAFDLETIFEVMNPSTGTRLFLSNTKSTVDIGGGYVFRNPPMYNSIVDPTPRDAMYETDEILETYVKHPNTAPFLATKLIQSLITSNPSPRFVKVVADAFRTGLYSSNGINFGSGSYGDLEALFAAIMLDSEARSTTLDDDPNHGRTREPLLKIIHMYRSMQLSTESGVRREIDSTYLLERGLGQEAFRAPSVFGFFLSEFRPVGPTLNKGLVAPEAQLLDAPKLVSFINGLFSLPVFGLSDCLGWQGFGDDKARYKLTDYPDQGSVECSNSYQSHSSVPLALRWKPPSWGGQTNIKGATVSAVINDVDLLLTGGRLHSSNKALLTQVYSKAQTGSDPDIKALKTLLQHYSAVPEFHITSNLVSSSSTTTVRAVPNITIPIDPPPVTNYKAIVYLYMNGGVDGYSMLVPTIDCGNLYSQYASIRTAVAISSNSSLPINADISNQPCSTFGLHPSLANIHSLYNAGDAAWIANVGPLVEQLNKVEFNEGSKPVPQALFAHNTQTQVTQTVFLLDSKAGGVIGRIGDAINIQAGEEVFDAYSILGTPTILRGAPGVSKGADVLTGNGVASFNNMTKAYEENIKALTKNIVTSIHGETFSSLLTSTVYRADLLNGVVGEVILANDACFTELNTSIAEQFRQVARIMKKRDILEAHRDAFYTELGGFDTHYDNVQTTQLLKQIDDAIGCFKVEMVSQGIWDNVTIVSGSEFGRTLTFNGQGTDHAWGSNHFIVGGNVKGGRIHGEFPSDLTENGDLNIGLGRLIPTTSWEGVWNGLAEWFGVSAENINKILPNKIKFSKNIFSENDLFD